MNWMSNSLKTLGWNSLLLGAVAGIWGGALYQGAGWLLAPLQAPAPTTLATGMVLGLGLCSLLASVDDLYNRFWRRASRSALAGGALGLAAGGVGFGLVWLILAAFGATGGIVSGFGVAHWLVVPLLMGLFGGAAGLGSCFSASGLQSILQKGLRRGLTGLAAGVALGLPLTGLLALAGGQGWLFQAAFAAWGALVALALYWGEKKTARRWLRVLTGPGEDTFYPLIGNSVTLGKTEFNDIPLTSYQEIFPFHCQLRWETDHYKIVDREQGGMVLVNYRQIQEQDLKHGDLVKLGTALLQYGETS